MGPLIFLITIIIAIFLTWRSGGQNAPGRTAPPPPPPPAEGGSTRVLVQDCYNLKRDGQTSTYNVTVPNDRTQPHAMKITNTKMETLPTGLTAKLTHRLFIHGGLRETTVTGNYIKQGATTRKFNGKLALASKQNPSDFVTWEGNVKSTGGVPLPSTISICVDLAKW